MRIISGNFKGKKLLIPNKTISRPLKDIVKESIFNVIHHSRKIKVFVENSHVLDLFSGSGSFGLECLSRKAEKVIFVEKNFSAVDILQKNLNSLKNVHNYEIIKEDCFNFFEQNNKDNKKKFDIIFIDPPYKEKKLNLIIEKIKYKKLLNHNGLIIIHRHKNDNLKFSEKISVHEIRNYGISKIYYCS